MKHIRKFETKQEALACEDLVSPLTATVEGVVYNYDGDDGEELAFREIDGVLKLELK